MASKPKKQKQNKIPQRGLGVAKLEKMRMQEQQQSCTASCQSSPGFLFSPSRPSPATPPDMLFKYPMPARPLMRASSDTEEAVNRKLIISSLNWTSIEPPSNQSFSSGSNFIPPSSSVDERAVGAKRSCPFHLNADHSKTTHIDQATSTSKAKNLPQSSDGSEFNKFVKENGACFLTLGPSPTPSLPQTKLCQCHQHIQACMGNGKTGHQPFFTFLPVTQDNIRQANHSDGSCKELDGLDLNLKL